MPYAHLERCSACSVFCSRDHPATDTGFRHQGPSRNRSQAVIRLIFGSASARRPCPQVLQWHPHVPNNPTISLKPASNRTSTGPRHGHPAHRHLSAIPTCRDVPKPISERCSERFLRRSSDRLPVRARLFGGRGEKEVGKCLEFRNLRLLQGALDGEGTVQNIDRFH